jgi:hypothetical protein
VIKILEHIKAHPTNKVACTRWDNNLSIHMHSKQDPNTYEMSMLSQYMMEVRIGRTFTCKKEDYEACFEQGVRAMQRDLYDEMREPFYALERAVYEEDSEACRKSLTEMRKLMFEG